MRTFPERDSDSTAGPSSITRPSKRSPGYEFTTNVTRWPARTGPISLEGMSASSSSRPLSTRANNAVGGSTWGLMKLLLDLSGDRRPDDGIAQMLASDLGCDARLFQLSLGERHLAVCFLNRDLRELIIFLRDTTGFEQVLRAFEFGFAVRFEDAGPLQGGFGCILDGGIGLADRQIVVLLIHPDDGFAGPNQVAFLLVEAGDRVVSAFTSTREFEMRVPVTGMVAVNGSGVMRTTAAFTGAGFGHGFRRGNFGSFTSRDGHEGRANDYVDSCHPFHSQGVRPIAQRRFARATE